MRCEEDVGDADGPYALRQPAAHRLLERIADSLGNSAVHRRIYLSFSRTASCRAGMSSSPHSLSLPSVPTPWLLDPANRLPPPYRLVHYTPQATLVRLLTINSINAYITSWVLYLSGGSEDPRQLLPAWISIASVRLPSPSRSHIIHPPLPLLHLPPSKKPPQLTTPPPDPNSSLPHNPTAHQHPPRNPRDNLHLLHRLLHQHGRAAHPTPPLAREHHARAPHLPAAGEGVGGGEECCEEDGVGAGGEGVIARRWRGIGEGELYIWTVYWMSVCFVWLRCVGIRHRHTVWNQRVTGIGVRIWDELAGIFIFWGQ